MKKKLVIILLFTILVLTFIFRQQEKEYFYNETAYLDIVSSLHLKNISKTKAQAIFKEVKSLLALFDETFSLRNKKSFLTIFNSLEVNKPFKLSPLFAQAYFYSLDFYQQSKHILDPSIYPYAQAWGFIPDGLKKKPSSTLLKQLSPLVGLDKFKLSIKNNDYFLTKTVESIHLKEQIYRQSLDFGFFLKGFICDEVANILRKHDIKEATFNCGLSSGFVWGKEEAYIKYRNYRYNLLITNSAYSISGDAYRFFKNDNIIYSHLFDAFSGQALVLTYPYVAIFNTSALLSDYLSTLACIKGEEILKKCKQALWYKDKWYTKNIVLK